MAVATREAMLRSEQIAPAKLTSLWGFFVVLRNTFDKFKKIVIVTGHS